MQVVFYVFNNTAGLPEYLYLLRLRLLHTPKHGIPEAKGMFILKDNVPHSGISLKKRIYSRVRVWTS